ncbi:hypothetical protein [Mesoflavibacter profundi]|uniref:Lipocalin-like domain-containing protein n=1 Tax=Mesoflavibacter profundi TaxID=2708110 RepID=A0ABT4RXM4_9FLAO|nr:hypothetical protein [Mesoflavibacter profundi]MDA0176565.1 hypothetical protein [Mesoflavibacter profundi]
MKFLKPTTLLLFCLLLWNCSEDDTSSEDTPNETFTGNFFPLTTNNEWRYEVNNTDNDTNTTETNEDVLTVESESSNGFTLTANDGTVAFGTMSNILTTGELTRTETTLATNGSLSLPIDGLDFSIDFNNALLYDTEASLNTELSSQTDSFTQDLQGFPITITYELTSTQLENLGNLSVLNTNYDTVTSANITLRLSVSTTVTVGGFTQTLSLIDMQDVMSVDAFYAKNVGLISTDAQIGYTLNANTLALLELAGIELTNLPTSMSVTNTQELTTYTLQ